MGALRRRLEALEAKGGPPRVRAFRRTPEQERAYEELYKELDRLHIEAGEEPPMRREGETRDEVFARLFDLIEGWQKERR